MSLETCELDSLKNLGITKCNRLPALLRGMIKTPYDFKLSAADAVDQTKWQDALLDVSTKRSYLFPWFVNNEPMPKEASYQDTNLAYLAVDDGDYRWRFHIRENLCIHKAMYTHRSNFGRVFLIDKKNQIIGTTNDAGEFRGFTYNLLHTEKMIFTDGGGVATTSPIVLSLANNLEFDKDGAMLDADWVNELLRIVDLKLTIIGNPSATTIVVKVAIACTGEPLVGLADADFILKTTAGAAQTISDITDNGDGTYTLTDTDFASGTLTLKAPSALSLKAYEADTATVTVV